MEAAELLFEMTAMGDAGDGVKEMVSKAKQLQVCVHTVSRQHSISWPASPPCREHTVLATRRKLHPAARLHPYCAVLISNRSDCLHAGMVVASVTVSDRYRHPLCKHSQSEYCASCRTAV